MFNKSIKTLSYTAFAILLLLFFFAAGYIMKKNDNNYNTLTPYEESVIIHKGTEKPFFGEYVNTTAPGLYVCRQCNFPLYESKDKFVSECGWPSFDDEIKGHVLRVTDADGRRTEIICANCKGHLGHVFEGEHLTDKNVRHCVNSVSMKFIPATDIKNQTEKAIFAGGCFWGVEYYMKKIPGVSTVISGYTGGKTENPTYEEVCSGKSGHIEAVEISFNPQIVSYETLAKTFFEIHDPEQDGRQGPDIGSQYQSAIFYIDDKQKIIIEQLIAILTIKGYKIKTKILPSAKFFPAEEYHQNYYYRKGSVPYCHKYTKRF